MKKIMAIALVVVGLVLATGTSVSAQKVGSPKPTPAKVKTQNKNNQSVKNQFTEKHKETVRKFWGKMAKRLGVIVRNEKKIAEKMAKRIEKRAAAGKDVVAAQAKLEEGKKLITEAETMINNGSANVEKILASGVDAKTAMEQVRQLTKDVVAKIRAAHSALVQSLKEARGLKATPTPSPTPTPTQ